MSNFTSPETGDFDKYFMTTTELIDRFAQGGLWLWGYNYKGALGDSTETNRSSPVQTISKGTTWRQVEVTGGNFASIKSDGTLWTCGYNSTGQLGNNNTTSQSSPVQTVATGTNWKQVCAGAGHMAAVKTDGTLWLWGANNNRQLGDSTTTNRSSPVQTICGGNNWKQVDAFNHTAAIKIDGTLWIWGSNSNGELGDSTRTGRSSPIQTISGGTNWKQVSCGNTHTAAIKTDGTLWLWGANATYGNLGDSTTDAKSSPVQTIAGGTNWKQVSCGNTSTCAIKIDGTLWTWGYNTYGQLGDNTRTHRSSPVQTISGGTNWKQVSCGSWDAAAIKTDGTLWTWGDGSSGKLGDDSVSSKSSPVQTITAGTNWKQVSAYSTMAAVQYSDIGQVL